MAEFSFADRRAGPRTCRCRPGIIQVPPGEQKEATMPEPVTTGILAALAVAGSETVKLAVGEAYAGLRSLLVRKLGGSSNGAWRCVLSESLWRISGERS